eukprot:scaffold170358_cov44-Prasinocladus_malaysianus.AAC.1
MECQLDACRSRIEDLNLPGESPYSRVLTLNNVEDYRQARWILRMRQDCEEFCHPYYFSGPRTNTDEQKLVAGRRNRQRTHTQTSKGNGPATTHDASWIFDRVQDLARFVRFCLNP